MVSRNASTDENTAGGRVPATTDEQFDNLMYPHDRLAIGDEIVIRILNAHRADEPRKPDDGVYFVEFETAT